MPKEVSQIQLGRIVKACSISFYALALSSGVAQAQCNFFTGFTDNKDGTVTDTRNGLIWKRCAEGFDFSNGVCAGDGAKADWVSAKLMAQQSRFLDKDDWRLPTNEEFEAVLGAYSGCRDNQNGEYAASKAIAHTGGVFWSGSPSVDGSVNAWGIDFNVGIVSGYYYRNVSYYVRLVRAGHVLGGEAALEFLNEPSDKARIEAERYRMDEEHSRVKLKAMPKDEFCANYGFALRGLSNEVIGELPELEFIKLVKKEASRRKLKFDDKLTTKGTVKIGISECQLYASWGLPEEQNRTVGGWGVHTQHVYGSGIYVYTENGRVTSWQD